mmetsp:Transcript_10972/g.12282  ORF Transcript_10972/g.12282 Transcript_10972/m.12282 type:complete len:85 (-) Transcript_10972:88-342(-)
MPALQLRSLGDLALVHNRALVDAVLLDDLAIMEHVKLLGGILASKQHDRLLAAWVVRHEVGHVVSPPSRHQAVAILAQASPPSR